MNSMGNEYNYDIQNLLISYMLADSDSYIKCQNILKDIYFDDRLRSSVRFISEYAEKYKSLPQLKQVKAATSLEFDQLDVSSQHSAWFLDTVESFAKYRALEIAVIEGADLVMQGKGGELEKRIKEALSISLMNDLGTDYFHDPVARIEHMKDNSALYSTGWKSLDERLFGGFTKGGLNIFAAASGVGKSLWLQNIAINWASMGKHVVYISLELSEDLVANRLDAMFAGVSTKDVLKNSREVGLKVKLIGQKVGGSIRIKRLPESSTTANDIRAYLKEYEIRNGHKPDALVVDYLDIMAPSAAVDIGNLSVKDKYVSEELRALMAEWDMIGATASQLNRSSIEASEFDHSHIAGGLTKIQTSDLSFGILAPPTWKDQGRMQLQLLKTRSSSGVGSKIEFRYDPVTMRITDREDLDEQQATMSTNELRQQLARDTHTPITVAMPMIPDELAKPNPADAILKLMSRTRNQSGL